MSVLDALWTLRRHTTLFVIIYVVRLCLPEFLRADNLSFCPNCQDVPGWAKEQTVLRCRSVMEPTRHWRRR